jgi:hypothetical protein
MSRAVAITMVRNESFMLPRWLEYYVGQLGAENVVVLDDGTTDGSTSGLDVSLLRVPPISSEPAKKTWGRRRGQGAGARQPVQFDLRRVSLVNHLSSGLLSYVDTVLYVDVDEFLVPHPRTGLDLRGYLARLDRRIVAGVGLNLIHQPSSEGTFDPERGFLEQRRHVAFVPSMCKPSVKRVPAGWLAGFHGSEVRYQVDPNLLLLHTKFFDIETALAVHKARLSSFHEGVGGKKSTWAMSPEELAVELSALATAPADGAVDLDVDELPLDVVRPWHKGRGGFRSLGSQLSGMRTSKVYRLPDGLRTQF